MTKTWISLKDIGLLGLIPAASLFAWWVPECHHGRVARGIARLRQGVKGDRERFERLIQSVIGFDRFGKPPQRIADEYFANLYLYRLFVLRSLAPGGWCPMTCLEGREHIDAALAAGKGAILWNGDFTFQAVPTLFVFDQAGYLCQHLARHSHGISKTAFGLRVLNWIEWRVVSSLHCNTLVIGSDGRIGSEKPLEALSRQLRANQLVLIRAYGDGARTETIPLLNGTVCLATGPLALAQRTGAAILPAWTVREPDGTIKTTVAPPLDVHDDRDPAGAIQRSLACYSEMHEKYVSDYPDQFGWHRVSAGSLGTT